jgi:hypothetical protein
MNISFADFWPGFLPNNNFFVDLFQSVFPSCRVVPFSNASTDILIYSCFGKTHTQANRSRVKKIFYTGENLRPNYEDCDYSFTFDFLDYGGRNIRIPLWMLQIDWFNKGGYSNPQFVIPVSELKQSRYSVRPKTKFCSIVFNTPRPNRIEILKKLSKYKQIDCFGQPFGNHFYGEDNKYDIISNYKFNICFENTIYPGYYTEKLIHAKIAGCIPLYCADDQCNQDFNPQSFLNLYNFDSMESYIEKIIDLDRNQQSYEDMFRENLFEKHLPSLDKVKDKISRLITL